MSATCLRRELAVLRRRDEHARRRAAVMLLAGALIGSGLGFIVGALTGWWSL